MLIDIEKPIRETNYVYYIIVFISVDINHTLMFVSIYI